MSQDLCTVCQKPVERVYGRATEPGEWAYRYQAHHWKDYNLDGEVHRCRLSPGATRAVHAPEPLPEPVPPRPQVEYREPPSSDAAPVRKRYEGEL